MTKISIPLSLLTVAAIVVVGASLLYVRPYRAVARESSESAIERPVPSGPQPSATVDHNLYDFGIIGVGDEQSHTFTIRNRGEAPLRLRDVETTCTCTLGSLESDTVQPGEEATVTLEWVAAEPHKMFRQGASISTNDPRKPELRFIVSGTVEPLYHLTPQVAWPLGQISNKATTAVTGAIYSRVRESFELHQIVSSDSNFFEACWAPLEASELQRLQAKCGYSIRASVKPGLPEGGFRGALTLMTDFEEELKPALLLEGFVPGRIRIMGPGWSPEKNRLILGTFAARDGKQANLAISAQSRADTEFRILEHSVEHNKLQLECEHETIAEDQEIIRLAFTLPPSEQGELCRHDEAIPVTLTTNDPEFPQIEFTVSFVTY